MHGAYNVKQKGKICFHLKIISDISPTKEFSKFTLFMKLFRNETVL